MAPATAAAAIAGPKKAAILMVLLGEDLAGRLMKHLAQDEAAAIAREIASLGPIPADTAQQVLGDYFSAALRGPEDRGGPEIARRILAQTTFPQDRLNHLIGGGHDGSAAASALTPLLEADPAALAAAMAHEHPQTVALVLLHLPRSLAGRVIGRLPEEQRVETVLRMATLRRVRTEVLGEVALTLRDRLEDVAAEVADAKGAADPLARTASILSGMRRSEIRKLLDDLEADHPEEAIELRGRVFTFESLVGADDRGIQELLRQVETKTVALALKGADEAVTNKLLGNLSERAATMLKDEMEFLGSPRAADQDNARREIVGIALRLESEEKLRFDDGEA